MAFDPGRVAYLPVTLGQTANGQPIRMHLAVERSPQRRRRSRLGVAALIALGLLLGHGLAGAPHADLFHTLNGTNP